MILDAGLDSPVGALTLTLENDRIVRLRWAKTPPLDHPVADAAQHQMTAYFAGDRAAFELPLNPKASAFQAAFYAALCAIPLGQTRTYGDLAKALGVSPQAIGQACGANPIPILIPCHRVLGADNLGGFSGGTGVETKVALLRHEGAAGLLI